MPDTVSRRAFLIGVLSCGASTAAVTYFLPGGKPAPPVRLRLLTGADSTGGRKLLFDMWNAANPGAPVDVIVLDGSTVDQKKRMTDAAINGTADLLNLDIINIQEFAAKGLVSRIKLSKDQFLTRTIEASQVSNDANEYWAAPFNTDVGMLFERVPTGATAVENLGLPNALDNLAPGSQGFVGQVGPGSSASDEAFVVNALEHALSRDSGILDEDGIPIYDLGHWQRALDPLRAAIVTRRVLPADNEATSLSAFIGEPGPRYIATGPCSSGSCRRVTTPV